MDNERGELLSVGRLAVIAGVLPSKVEAAAEAIDAAPWKVNGLTHYDLAACQKILEILFSEKSK